MGAIGRASWRWIAAAGLALALAACARDPSGPAMWKLKDADSEIWLLGTVHVLPGKLKWKGRALEQAFRAADVVYFETPTDAAAGRDIAALAQRYGTNEAGVTLSSLIAPQDRVRLARVCERLGLDPKPLETLKPWLAAVQLSTVLMIKNGRAREEGVERVLEGEAAALGKTRAYLETGAQQIEIFGAMAIPAQARFLSSTLSEIEAELAHDSDDELDRLWANGKAKELGARLDRMIEASGPEVAEALIYRRNERWADEIDAMMKGKGKIFIAVGAAHLSGAHGVPELLRRKGYVVEGP